MRFGVVEAAWVVKKFGALCVVLQTAWFRSPPFPYLEQDTPQWYNARG